MRTGRPRSVSNQAIFDAVSAVVTEVGPSGLTLAAVARRAGLSPPALTQRFGTKREMLLSYARSQAGAVDELFDRARAVSPSALGALHTALAEFTAGLDSRAAVANNLAFLQLDLTDPDFGAEATAQSRVLRRRIAELLEAAAREGTMKKVEASALADTVYTVYNGALVSWAIDGQGPLEAWVAERIDRVLAHHRR